MELTPTRYTLKWRLNFSVDDEAISNRARISNYTQTAHVRWVQVKKQEIIAFLTAHNEAS